MGLFFYVLIIAIVWLYISIQRKMDEVKNDRKEHSLNAQVEVSNFRSKYDADKWDLISSHADGPYVVTNILVESYKDRHLESPRDSHELRIKKVFQKFINMGDPRNTKDLMQRFDETKLENLIRFCRNDFTLSIFCFLYLSEEQYRLNIQEDEDDLELLMDIIHSRTVIHLMRSINHLENNQRYILGKLFTGTYRNFC